MRAVGSVLAFYGVVVAGAALVWLAAPAGWVGVHGGLALQSGAVLVSALAAYSVILAMGWGSWSFVGWPGARLAVWGVLAGLGCGAAMAVLALALAVGPGSARMWWVEPSLGEYARAVFPLMVLLLAAALAEELLFRGYPLQRLAARFGKVPAAVALSVVFGLAHSLNPGSSPLGIVNVGLASLVLSMAFFTRGGLPAAWGLHFGWNAGLGLAADAPVSGIRLSLPGPEYAPGGPTWLTGGDFGPEGGAVATVVMLAVLLLFARNYSRLMEDRTK